MPPFSALTVAETDADSPLDTGLFTKIKDNFDNLDSRVAGIVSGTTMVFFQASAPTGWTQDTTHNDKTLRVVSGTGAGSGGSHSISSPPTHTHSVPRDGWGNFNSTTIGRVMTNDGAARDTATNGVTSGGTTGFSPYYINVIVATRD